VLDHHDVAAGAAIVSCHDHLTVSRGDHRSADEAPYIHPPVRAIPAEIALGTAQIAKARQDSWTKGTTTEQQHGG
jgi:hypothetical protein